MKRDRTFRAICIVCVATLVLCLGMSVVSAQRRRSGQEPAGRVPGPAVECRQSEVMRIGLGCNSDYVNIKFWASGGAVDGLFDPRIQGSSSGWIYVPISNCETVIGEIENSLSEYECVSVTLSEQSRDMVCYGDRDAIIGIAWEVLRTAYQAGT